MSGQDEAARLEAALERISRAAVQAESRAYAMAARHAALHDTPAGTGPTPTEVATRLDALIAELRDALGTDA